MAADEYDFDPTPSPAPQVTTETPAPAAPTPARDESGRFLPKPKHSPRLIKMASDLGFTEDEINSTDSDQLFRDVQLASLEQQRSRAENSVAAKVRETEAAPPEPIAELDWGKDDDGTVLGEKDYPPHIAALMRDVHELKAQNKALAQRFGNAEQFIQGQVNQTFTQKIDARFAERKDIFGEGDASKVKKGTPERQRREKIIELMSGDKEGTIDERFDRAFSTLYGFATSPTPTKLDTPADPPRPAMTKERWDAATLGPATQRSGSKEPKGVEAAKRAFAAGVAELHQRNGDGDTNYFD